VIYLSLIITLKRGVVVLWLPVVGHYHLACTELRLLVVSDFSCLLVRARAPSKQEKSNTTNKRNEVRLMEVFDSRARA